MSRQGYPALAISYRNDLGAPRSPDGLRRWGDRVARPGGGDPLRARPRRRRGGPGRLQHGRGGGDQLPAGVAPGVPGPRGGAGLPRPRPGRGHRPRGRRPGAAGAGDPVPPAPSRWPPRASPGSATTWTGVSSTTSTGPAGWPRPCWCSTRAATRRCRWRSARPCRGPPRPGHLGALRRRRPRPVLEHRPGPLRADLRALLDRVAPASAA